MKIGYSQSDCTSGDTFYAAKDTVYATGTATIPSYTISTSSPYSISTSIPYDGNDFLSKFNKYFKEQAKEESLLQVNIGEKKINLTDKILQIKKEQEVEFVDIIERNPNRVYEFVFQDGTHIKTVCAEEDLEAFDLEFSFYLALAKYLYGNIYTFENIYYHKVYDLMGDKHFIKVVNKGMKLFKTSQEQDKKIKEKERRIKDIKKNHYRKNERRKKAKKEKELEELKNIIIEALNESK